MKQLIACALALTLSIGAFAQKADKQQRREPMTAEQRAEKRTAKMAEELKLTAEQRQKVAQINLETARKMQPHVDAVKSERKAMREIAKHRNQELRSVLTDEQVAQLKAKHAEKRGQKGMRKGQLRDGGRQIERSAPADVR